MPFLFGQVSPFFHDEAACIEYLWHQGVFYTAPPTCSKEGCGKEMKLEVTLKRIRWRCMVYKCNSEQGIRKDAPFEGKKQEMHKLLFLCRMLLDNEPVMRIPSYTGLNTRTISLLAEDFNELFLCDMASIPNQRIRGEGVIVEIDESKFGKRKYHRGHRVEGVWAVGSIERTEGRHCFLVVVEDRTQPRPSQRGFSFISCAGSDICRINLYGL